MRTVFAGGWHVVEEGPPGGQKLLHVATHAGVPAANHALKIAKEVLAA